MGYHHCPIEPSDWSDGPNDEEGNCPDCLGTGRIACRCDDPTECPECVDGERSCNGCYGSGLIDDPYFDDDYL